MFNEILEKLRTQLSKWKARNLFLAGRTTLIQSITSVMPRYNMQTMELPRNLCDEINRINGNFLWGETNNNRKVHLVSWENVCRTKEDGGLGIRKARDHNATLLTKLGQRILSDNDKLWCKVLKAKYLKKNTLYSWPLKKRASHTSICKNKDILRKGVKWNVGNGETISLWHDWWYGQEPLDQTYGTSQVNDKDKVSLFLDDKGHQNIEVIANIVSQQDLQVILKVHRSSFVTYNDAPTWIGSSGGNFSTASAYKLIVNHEMDKRDQKWIWKVKTPQKLKGFMWLILKDRLLTNQMRLMRNMETIDLCPRCGLSSEDMSRLFRECTKAKDIWIEIKNHKQWEKGYRLPLHEWVVSNMKNKNVS